MSEGSQGQPKAHLCGCHLGRSYTVSCLDYSKNFLIGLLPLPSHLVLSIAAEVMPQNPKSDLSLLLPCTLQGLPSASVKA